MLEKAKLFGCYSKCMQPQFYKVEISAETQQQADVILNGLLAKKLVTGGQFISSPARFWWKGQIQDMQYITITSYTTAAQKNAIFAEVKTLSQETLPMVTFYALESNQDMYAWIRSTVSGPPQVV
jgi:uncharacterized protein involved in tolerance to divalent cations